MFLAAAVVTVLFQEPPPTAARPAPAALQQALALAVDRPTATERARAAAQLAARTDVRLDDWLAACAAFAPRERLAAGSQRHVASLPVLQRVEDTELHVYVPARAATARSPLLLFAHGAGGSGDGQQAPWQEVADQLGMVVLAPTEFGDEPGYGFHERERANHLAAVRWLRRRTDVDENAVFVGGVSRGGHLAWDLALRCPDRFAGALPCIGGPRLQLGPQNNLRFLENVRALPIRDLQGALDDPLLLQNLRLCFARLRAFGGDQQLIEFADRGHDFDLSAVDWPSFFASRRDPAREAIVHLAVDAAGGRHGWLCIDGVGKDVAATFELRVAAERWQRLDEPARREFALDQAIAHTARLEGRRTAPGRFVLAARGVTKARLLLTAAMVGPGGRVAVQWQGRTIEKKAVPSAAVLLGEFVERFDRTFLPVVEIVVP